MCGIVGGYTNAQPIAPLLIEGLERLEYRGYDSAGFALVESNSEFHHKRAVGKVASLVAKTSGLQSSATLGVAHTRWATHGSPVVHNAHPHCIGDRLFVVHNGIIENYRELLAKLPNAKLSSETDTEVVGWRIFHHLQTTNNLHQALVTAAHECQGSYALVVVDIHNPQQLVAIRRGSPLVLGVSDVGIFVASDPLALIGHTSDFAFIQESESLHIQANDWCVYNQNGAIVERKPQTMVAINLNTNKGNYDHYMLKEIDEQPTAIAHTLSTYVHGDTIALGNDQLANAMRSATGIQMVACGTSAYAAMVAKYWIEAIAGIDCQVEVASEFRYRKHAPCNNKLYITLSQSGETADTLESLRLAKTMPYLARIAITNSPYSTIVRECDHYLVTQAGVEVSVASTKAFTAQLVVLLLCTLSVAKVQNRIDQAHYRMLIAKLSELPQLLQQVLSMREQIAELAAELVGKNGVMFLGRSTMFPVALEGALKLKEIAYIHAEAYPAGELKHGPLALIDHQTPVIAVSPPSELLHKLHINLEEVQARGALMLLFIDEKQQFASRPFDRVLYMPSVDALLAPFVYTIPLQLLAYYTAAHSGTDVDKPRNLAKSVTVE